MSWESLLPWENSYEPEEADWKTQVKTEDPKREIPPKRVEKKETGGELVLTPKEKVLIFFGR